MVSNVQSCYHVQIHCTFKISVIINNHCISSTEDVILKYGKLQSECPISVGANTPKKPLITNPPWRIADHIHVYAVDPLRRLC